MKKKIWLLIAFCAFFSAGILAFTLWKRESDREKAQQLYKKQQEDHAKERQTTITPTPEPEETKKAKAKKEKVKETKEPLEIPVDFQSLQQQNPDIYAWITIPGTVIDYPIVQSADDNEYYLNRAADGSININGSVFSENYNGLDFDDPVTVLYGHNMNDGSMFAGLHQYEDNSFMESHRTINVYTPNAILHYQVFAAYLYDNRHLLDSFHNCTDSGDMQAYIDEIMGQRSMSATIDDTALVTTDSHILTLSTCHGAGRDYRFLVQAYLAEKLTQ